MPASGACSAFSPNSVKVSPCRSICLTLRLAVTRIAEFMQAEAASLFLLDPTSGLLECRICVGPVDIGGLKLAIAQGVVGRCVAEQAT
jgi:sigma-B regulation protein RsbU (phosphoserine phosphatase)